MPAERTRPDPLAGNIQIVGCVRIVRIPGRVRTIWRDPDGA
jgi:hypothetical protein